MAGILKDEMVGIFQDLLDIFAQVEKLSEKLETQQRESFKHEFAEKLFEIQTQSSERNKKNKPGK